MPYVNKYSLSFLNRQNDVYTIYILQKDYVGAVIDLEGGPNPLILEYGSGDEIPWLGIRGLNSKVAYYNNGTDPLVNFASNNDDEYQVQVFKGSNLKFIGFLVQDNCSEDFAPTPNLVTLQATDNLALLKDTPFDADFAPYTVINADGETTTTPGDKVALLLMVKKCLSATGLDLPLNTYCNVFENGMVDRVALDTNDPFLQAAVDPRTFLKDNTAYEDCYTVLERIIGSWRCSLFQAEGEWHLVRWPEKKDFANAIPGTRYETQISANTYLTAEGTNAALNGSFEIIFDSFTGSDFTSSGNTQFTYTGTAPITATLTVTIETQYLSASSPFTIYIQKNADLIGFIAKQTFPISASLVSFDQVFSGSISLVTGDVLNASIPFMPDGVSLYIETISMDLSNASSEAIQTTPVVLGNVKDIGQGLQVEPINASHVKSIVRPVKYSSLTFNYEQEIKLIPNYDLSELGSFIGTNTIGSIRYDDYQLSGFTNMNGNDAFIRVETNIITDNELQRYVYQPYYDTGNRFFKVDGIVAQAGDKMDFSCSFKAVVDSGDNTEYSVNIMLVVGADTYYLSYANVPDFTGVPVWRLNTPVYQTLSVKQDGGVDISQWATFSLSAFNNGDPVTFPADGILKIHFYSEYLTNAAKDTLTKEFNLTYYAYINESTQIIGHIHKSEQAANIKKVSEEIIYIDDSPRNSIKGTMFLMDQVTKTRVWRTNFNVTLDIEHTAFVNTIGIFQQPALYPFFRDGIIFNNDPGDLQVTISGTQFNDGTYHVNEISNLLGDNFVLGVDEPLVAEGPIDAKVSILQRFGYIQALDTMYIDDAIRYRVEGDFFSLKDSVGDISLLTLFTINTINDTFFIMGPVSLNYHTCIWSGTLEELWKTTEEFKGYKYQNTFKYIYKTK